MIASRTLASRIPRSLILSIRSRRLQYALRKARKIKSISLVPPEMSLEELFGSSIDRRSGFSNVYQEAVSEHERLKRAARS